MLLRAGLPPALPAQHDTRRFHGVLEFNLSVHASQDVGFWEVFAAIAKATADATGAPAERLA
jgi:hypothetical protein